MRNAVLAVLISAIIGGVTVASGQSDGPSLTALEQARFENHRLRVALATSQAQADGCRAELGAAYQALGQLRAAAASRELTAAEAALKAEIEAAHPGFTWDPKTGRFAPQKGGS